jgi:hypothetical protein
MVWDWRVRRACHGRAGATGSAKPGVSSRRCWARRRHCGLHRQVLAALHLSQGPCALARRCTRLRRCGGSMVQQADRCGDVVNLCQGIRGLVPMVPQHAKPITDARRIVVVELDDLVDATARNRFSSWIAVRSHAVASSPKSSAVMASRASAASGRPAEDRAPDQTGLPGFRACRPPPCANVDLAA